MSYTKFNKSTGQITGCLSCSEAQLPSNIYEGEDYIDGIFSDALYYIAGSTLVDMPISPTSHHLFNWETKEWYDPRTVLTQWPIVREQRNELLASSDWTQLPDVPLPTKEAWAAYRQALRDVTDQPDPFEIVWPTAP